MMVNGKASHRHKLVGVQVLTHPDNEAAKVWLEDCRHSFAQMIHDKLTRDAEEAKTKVGLPAVRVLHPHLSRLFQR